MKNLSILFCFLSWFILNGIVLGVNPFEGGLMRLQCTEHARIEGCNKNFMEAYMETEIAQEDKYMDDPDTYFLLFTRRNANRAEYLHKCPGILPSNTHFRSDRKTVIIVHGYKENVCGVAWMREMKDQFLCRGDYNVILVDYGWGNQLDYYDAVQNLKVVGKQIAFLLFGIMNQSGAPPEKFHIIGHSLGAHVAGYAGEHLKGDKKIERITGLDPAGPGFRKNDPEDRLDSSDAKCVDVIHTNAGNCTSLGYEDPVGHADFYVNGGKVQKSCFLRNLGSFLKGDITRATLALIPMFCYHQQSVEYFIASINPCKCQIIGVESDDYESSKDVKSCDGGKCAVMGLDWKNCTEGCEDGTPHKYYAETALKCPYCACTGLSIENNSSMGKEEHCFES